MKPKECAKAESFSAMHVQMQSNLNHLNDGGLVI